MSLSAKQQRFTQCLGEWIFWATTDLASELGVKLGFTFGDTWASSGHMPNSCHYVRLAADLNLFIDGNYIARYDQAPLVWDALMAKWEDMDSQARAGGRFGDYNHWSFEHEGRK